MISLNFKKMVLPILAGCAFIFALIVVMGNKKESYETPLVMPPTPSSLDYKIAGIGVIEPQSEVITIGTDITGIVKQVHVLVGDSVACSAPLFTLDTREIDALIATQRSETYLAYVECKQAKELLALVEAVTDKRAISQDELIRRSYTYQQASARLIVSCNQLQQSLVTKDRLTVRSPIAGTILDVNIRLGEYAANSSSMPLMKMGDISTLHVRVEVDEVQAALIAPHSVAEGYLRGDSKNAIPLQFVRFEPLVRPKQNLPIVGQRVDTRVLQIIYKIVELPRRVFVGQQLDVFIDGGSNE